jgi:hypothetical protein
MSVIIAQGEVISKSPMNTSTAKARYTFPKTKRFLEFKSATCDQFYKLPEVRSTRAASIGRGTKYDFTKGKTGAPFYNMPTDFDQKKPHSPMFTFGVSRGFYEKVRRLCSL